MVNKTRTLYEMDMISVHTDLSTLQFNGDT